jgi:2-hydroxymuconate-semialdehyde hydrolase
MQGFREFDLPVADTTMHCWDGGKGETLLFFHGSGTGAQTSSNFKSVLGPLAKRYRVLATDLIGYGASGLKKVEPFFDMDIWGRQVTALLDYSGVRSAILVGHSLSASFVLKAASTDPRVGGVLGTAPFGVTYPVPPDTKGWSFPESAAALRAQVERTVFDPRAIDDAEIDLRWKTLTRPGYREYFAKMYPKGRQHYLDISSLTDDELRAIKCPVVLMHGANDISFGPEKTSLVLAKKIERCDVVILNRCGHSIALEHPEKFIGVVDNFFAHDGRTA